MGVWVADVGVGCGELGGVRCKGDRRVVLGGVPASVVKGKVWYFIETDCKDRGWNLKVVSSFNYTH